MSTELCRVTTSDGLYLDGALNLPAQSARDMPFDACLIVHGTGSNFYSPGVLEMFSRQVVDAGIASLRVNTRGHDLMARVHGEKSRILGGASYEHIADCRHDLTAWTTFLTQRGYRRIALVGHSVGGVKGIYTISREPLEHVTALLALSPPRFCHEHFQRHKLAGQFREDYRRADAMVSRGEGETLLQVRQPLQMVIPATGFVAKYGPHDNFDIIKLLPHVRCPTLILIGSESARTSAAFDGLQEQLQRLSVENLKLAVRVVEGADIGYTHHQGAPFEYLMDWSRAS